MNKLYSLIFTLCSFWVYSQYCPYLGPNQTLPCGINQTTLTADLSQCGPGSQPNQTTSYGVTNIPYVAQVNNGTQVFLGDDTQSNPYNIGFTFCFYGQTYTQFRIGSNGWISLGAAGQPANFTSMQIPTMNAAAPKNCIMGPWQDWNPGVGGQIRFTTIGNAPCRRLIVSWIGIPMFSCFNLQGTFHIILYESSNIIENHIANKPNCTQWAGGTAVQGIHDLTGAQAVTVPGRNSTQWTTANNSYRYTPSGPAVTPTYTWFQVGNPNPIGTGPTITVTPPAQGANYTCIPVYPTCNAGWSSCNLVVGNLGPDTVFVIPTPNLPNPNVIPTDPLCNNSCDGTIGVTPVGGSQPFNITWNNGENSLSLNNLCSGTYTFVLTDANGCVYNGTSTLNNPLPLQSPTITPTNPVCYNDCNGSAIVNPINGIAPYTYLWSDGQTGQTATGLCPGNYSVTVTDANGCTSSQTTTLSNPLQVTVSAITASDTVCFGSSFDTYTVTNQPGYTYTWSTIGNIVSGQGSNTLNVDWSNEPSGFVPGAVQVTTYNAVGCSSLPSTFDLRIFNITPSITPMGPYCSTDGCENLEAIPAGGTFYINGNAVTQFCPQTNSSTDSVIYVYIQSGCSFGDTTAFVVHPQPNITSIIPENYFIELCEGDTSSLTYTITSTLPGVVDWNFGGLDIQSGPTQSFSLSGFGIFTVSAILTTPEGCVSPTETTTITIQECPNTLYYIPNSFTPDGNQYNQTWTPVFTSGFDPSEFHLTVFSRWGNIVWESFSHLGEWDGTFNNSLCPDGVYTYKVWFGDPKTDAKYQFTGHLIIIR